jgi:hypothetical protein
MKKLNNNPNQRQSLSQTKKIKRHLLKGHSVTPIEALNKWGCFRLGARIYDLQRSPHYLNIESRMKLLRSGKRVSEYRMKIEQYLDFIHP